MGLVQIWAASGLFSRRWDGGFWESKRISADFAASEEVRHHETDLCCRAHRGWSSKKYWIGKSMCLFIYFFSKLEIFGLPGLVIFRLVQLQFNDFMYRFLLNVRSSWLIRGFTRAKKKPQGEKRFLAALIRCHFVSLLILFIGRWIIFIASSSYGGIFVGCFYCVMILEHT